MRELTYTDCADGQPKRVDAERIEKIMACPPSAPVYAQGCRSVIVLQAQGVSFRRASETPEELERRLHAPQPARPASTDRRWTFGAALGGARGR